MIYKNTLLITLFMVLSFTAQSQMITYDVVKGSKTIGNVTLEISNENKQVKYHIKSTVNFKILFSFTVKYEMEEKFYNDELVWGKAFNTLNDRLQKESELNRDDQGNYTVNIDGVTSNSDEKNITYSVSKLYSEEPLDRTNVFSQQFGRYLPLTKVGDHQYTLESPDGNNVYTYELGVCREVKVSRDFATFYFRIQEESFARATKTK